MHHIAATETLRVLERRQIAALARFQVDQLGDHGCRAEIDGDSVHAAPVLVDGLVAVEDVVAFSAHQWVE